MKCDINEVEIRKLAQEITTYVRKETGCSLALKEVRVFLKHDNFLTVEKETGSFLYRPSRGTIGFVSTIPNINKVWSL